MEVLGFYLGREVFFAERVSFVVISFVSLFVLLLLFWEGCFLLLVLKMILTSRKK